MVKTHFSTENYAGVVVVAFTDTSILDSGVIEQIARELYPLMEERTHQKLILDFTHVKFLSSQVLGILVTLDKKAKANKGAFVLCGMRRELMKVFELTKLDKVFKFFPNDAAALASFKVFLD